MAQAVEDLVKKHRGSNAALYGKLTYIFLIATTGPCMKLYAMPVRPDAMMELVIDTIEVCIYYIHICTGA